MYATLNDILFPVFLFIFYFCAFSLLIYNPKNPDGEAPERTKPVLALTPIIEEEIPLAQPIIPEPEPESLPSFDEEEISLPVEPPTPAVEPESLPVEPSIPTVEPENPLYIQMETIITNLSKRQSRKICQPLGIQQKSGQTEKPLTSIKAEIGNLFHDNPEKVITVIQDKLPELLGLPTIIAS